MNWDAVGAIAELLSGAATVATLAYLAVQIRQATAATRARRQPLKGLLLRSKAYSSLTEVLGDVWNFDFAAEVERILAETQDAAV